ncbi:MAG: AtpZ/AtpI family protein [Saprospiraceae bacterium]|jgi:F0F1-type ATP synthase assembly protein I|nr:AtpZ/AtpI family protein [Saprospiraceae bacterium]MBK8669399.1 AtpZ/AtpI family protein [Saprospiraceae bacterium]MBL0100736.1 AtpZ/AtpI family protein [Saprospiraceae bacterium]
MKPPALPSNKKVNAYLKYSGLAFQLAAVVFIGIYAGKWIDSQLGMTKPIFTMILVLLLFSGYMYKLYKELTQKE